MGRNAAVIVAGYRRGARRGGCAETCGLYIREAAGGVERRYLRVPPVRRETAPFQPGKRLRRSWVADSCPVRVVVMRGACQDVVAFFVVLAIANVVLDALPSARCLRWAITKIAPNDHEPLSSRFRRSVTQAHLKKASGDVSENPSLPAAGREKLVYDARGQICVVAWDERRGSSAGRMGARRRARKRIGRDGTRRRRKMCLVRGGTVRAP